VHQEDGSRDVFEKTFQSLDVDGDRSISWDEFHNFYTGRVTVTKSSSGHPLVAIADGPEEEPSNAANGDLEAPLLSGKLVAGLGVFETVLLPGEAVENSDLDLQLEWTPRAAARAWKNVTTCCFFEVFRKLRLLVISQKNRVVLTNKNRVLFWTAKADAFWWNGFRLALLAMLLTGVAIYGLMEGFAYVRSQPGAKVTGITEQVDKADSGVKIVALVAIVLAFILAFACRMGHHTTTNSVRAFSVADLAATQIHMKSYQRCGRRCCARRCCLRQTEADMRIWFGKFPDQADTSTEAPRDSCLNVVADPFAAIAAGLPADAPGTTGTSPGSKFAAQAALISVLVVATFVLDLVDFQLYISNMGRTVVKECTKLDVDLLRWMSCAGFTAARVAQETPTATLSYILQIIATFLLIPFSVTSIVLALRSDRPIGGVAFGHLPGNVGLESEEVFCKKVENASELTEDMWAGLTGSKWRRRDAARRSNNSSAVQEMLSMLEGLSDDLPHVDLPGCHSSEPILGTWPFKGRPAFLHRLMHFLTCGLWYKLLRCMGFAPYTTGVILVTEHRIAQLMAWRSMLGQVQHLMVTSYRLPPGQSMNLSTVMPSRHWPQTCYKADLCVQPLKAVAVLITKRGPISITLLNAGPRKKDLLAFLALIEDKLEMAGMKVAPDPWTLAKDKPFEHLPLPADTKSGEVILWSHNFSVEPRPAQCCLAPGRFLGASRVWITTHRLLVENTSLGMRWYDQVKRCLVKYEASVELNVLPIAKVEGFLATENYGATNWSMLSYVRFLCGYAAKTDMALWPLASIGLSRQVIPVGVRCRHFPEPEAGEDRNIRIGEDPEAIDVLFRREVVVQTRQALDELKQWLGAVGVNNNSYGGAKVIQMQRGLCGTAPEQ